MSRGAGQRNWPTAARVEATGPADGMFFPLPPPDVLRLDIWGGHTRRGRAAALRDVQLAVWSLNWLQGSRHRPPGASWSASTRAKAAGFLIDVTERAEQLVSGWGVPPRELSSQAALRKLLRGTGSYSEPGAQAVPAPFSHARLAVPPSVLGAPRLSVLLDASEMDSLKRYHETMLRDEAEVRELDELHGEVRVHVDPVLLRQRKAYLKLLRTLHSCGLLRMSLARKCDAGIFFVTKKDGALRLFIDCRRANRRFRAPPGVSLLSSEGFGRIEVDLTAVRELCDRHEASAGLGMGTSDVNNCFHRMRFDEDSTIPEYFALPKITAPSWG